MLLVYRLALYSPVHVRVVEKALNQGKRLAGMSSQARPRKKSLPGLYLYLAVVFHFDFTIRGSSVYLISIPGLKIREESSLQRTHK